MRGIDAEGSRAISAWLRKNFLCNLRMLREEKCIIRRVASVLSEGKAGLASGFGNADLGGGDI